MEKRIFEKKSVVYTSQYGIDKNGNGIYLDQENQKNYLLIFFKIEAANGSLLPCIIKECVLGNEGDKG